MNILLDKPKISVIVPVYNAEKYVDECLNSLVNQTLSEIEIICINDGSTDNSLKILDKYAKKDNRVTVISTDNNGPGNARNIGLKKSKGEYISFIDADDWIDLDSFNLLYYRAKKNNLDMLFFQMINYINDTKKMIHTDLYDHRCFIDVFDENSIFSHENTQDFLFSIPVCPVSKIYKKDFLTKNNLLFPEGIVFEDNLFFYNSYFKANKLGFLEKQLYYRRRHKNSITQTFNKKKLDIVIVVNLILDLFKDLDKYEGYKKNVINHTFSMIYDWLQKIPLEYGEELFSLIKKNFKGTNELKCDFNDFLNDDNKNIFEIILTSDYYLDFITQYKLLITEYSKVIDSSDNNYKISVIIPIYNNEKILHRTLMSIENQSLGINNIEVILVNDCSTDSSSEIIDYYANNYESFKAIHLKNNTGAPGTPRNIGIKEASADYIMFLDHDDFFETNSLEILYDEIIKSKGDLVFGTYNVINDGKLKKIRFPNEKHGYFKNISQNERFVAYPPPSIWTKIFKREFILENNILFPPILGEDAIFMSKVFLNSKGITYLKDLLVCFHDLRKSSYTNNVSLRYLTEGFISEKYLLKLYGDMNKEYYFKFRCEGNLDFFLNQFLRSNLNEKEIIKLFPLLNWFVQKGKDYELLPSKKNNKLLFDFIIQGRIHDIINFKRKVECKSNISIVKSNLFKNTHEFAMLFFKRIVSSLKK